MTNERDYVLGTHDEELERLGLQHRAWQSVALDCWRRAGITAGSRVLDVGAGPGYATVDLAEIVGSAGEVVALERSHKFVAAIEKARRTRSLTNVKIKELDLMTDELPQGQFDFSWCRWVLCFVSDPSRGKCRCVAFSPWPLLDSAVVSRGAINFIPTILLMPRSSIVTP